MIILNENITLNQVLLEMTQFKIGCCFFIKSDEDQQLIGILTDGDIRRGLLENNKKSVSDYINYQYQFETDINKFISDLQNNC